MTTVPSHGEECLKDAIQRALDRARAEKHPVLFIRCFAEVIVDPADEMSAVADRYMSCLRFVRTT